MSPVKNTKITYIGILLLIMAILTTFRLAWFFHYVPSQQFFSNSGLLDFRDSNINADQTISLSDEWKFYPDILADQKSLQSNTHFIISDPANVDSSHHYGTYQLKIVMDEVPPEPLSIRIPPTNTASALFINGILLGESGKVSTDKEHHQGNGNPYTVSFSPESKEINIVLQVSNFDTEKGIAIKKPIKFSSADALAKANRLESFLLNGLVIVLLLHSLYSLLIYFFIHRNKILLLFSVGFVLPGIDELLTYDASAMEWLKLDYLWQFKLKELVYLGASFFLVQIMRVLLTNFHQYVFFHWYTFFYGISALLIIILPLPYLLMINDTFFILYIVSFLSVIFLAMKEFFQNQKESIFIAITVVSTTSGILWGLIKTTIGVDLPFYPFDYLCAFLGFALFWFKRFNRQNNHVLSLVEDLKQANQSKDKFLLNSANKLWSPLNKIITIAQSLYSKNPNYDLRYLIDIGKSTSFVLNDLRDFTRLNEGTMQIQPESINVQTITLGVFDMLKYMVEGKRLELISKIPTNFPTIYADEKKLIQILFNLLGNAVKYTNSGKITVRAKENAGRAVISIQDTGIGVDESTQKNILSAFIQGIKDDEGLGLGLSVSEKLIELHGGHLEMKSVIGEGSIFTFSLPLAGKSDQIEKAPHGETIAATVSSDAVTTDPIGGYQVLVVDDDPTNLKMIRSIFPPDYKVTTVTSGTEALELLVGTDWDLMIIDVMMPVISGYELTKLIRQQFSLIDLPILLLPSRNDDIDVNIGLTVGANDYVTKPINSIELKSRSIALIELKQSIKEKHKMESAWLQAQIRPHFLFNTLNTIASLSSIDSERMIKLLEKFGEYLSGSFKEENLLREIPIQNELSLVESYLYIQSERFGDRFQVKWEIDERLSVEVPPLSIQTLVENAVQHGVLKRSESGTVWIRTSDHPDFTEVAIQDDGVGMDLETVKTVLDVKRRTSKGIGLLNTNERLKRINGFGLSIDSSPNQGTTVSFKIPKRK